MTTTDDPTDPRLTHGVDSEPTKMAEVYLVLSDADRAKGWVRPYRDSYIHNGEDGISEGCGVVTRMGRALSETYARDPKFYGSTWCVGCQMHLPVSQFEWDGTHEQVGS